MSAKVRGLGRGLEALLGEAPDKPPAAGARPATVAIDELSPGPFQPRRRFDRSDLESLAASIKRHGIMQPILVREAAGEEGGLQIVAGERRWRAAQIARLHEVPVIVHAFDDRDALEIALIENVQREDLNPLEEAEGYRRLIDEFDSTQEQLAEAVGKSRSHVANMLRLLTLPEAVRGWVEDGSLSAGHARALLGAPDPVAMGRKVKARGLNVRQTERLVRRGSQPKRARAKNADVVRLEDDLGRSLGLKVTIADRGGRGDLRIAYKSLEQLDLVIERLQAVPVPVAPFLEE